MDESSESAKDLERRIDALRVAVREAIVDGDPARATALRRELRLAEKSWDEAVVDLARGMPQPAPSRPESAILPIRDQVHQALTLLSVPAAPKLITEVHRALFLGEVTSVQLTSLRRDEERSFRLAPYARPYYLCAALTAERLSPARGLLAISTWSMEQRIISALTPRVDFLIAAIRIAEHIARLSEANSQARHLLRRFAANVPGVGDEFGP